MWSRAPCLLQIVFLVYLAIVTVKFTEAQNSQSPEERAVTFLSTEVPSWFSENNCYSCHNNGDAARALYTAVSMAMPVEQGALRDTTNWLRRPETWDDDATRTEFNDRVLSRIQFSGALLAAIDARIIKDQEPLLVAANLIALEQKDDGSWRLDSSGSIGSPVTYGTALATWGAMSVLKRVKSSELSTFIAKGEQWIREFKVKTVIDAAAIVLGLGFAVDDAAHYQRQACLEIFLKGQAPSGGWGAYLKTPTEPFDTALVVLALSSLLNKPKLAEPSFDYKELLRLIIDGRAFLLSQQLDNGSWLETTRPPGQQSYAQYISTTGWSTLALLATVDIPATPVRTIR